MNNKLMREGLNKFIEAMELGINGDAREKILDNLEKLWSEVLLSGYTQEPLSALTTRQAALSRDPVFINNIPFVSICQDHLLPFSGFVSIGYLPDKEIAGLSNFGKLVHVLAARLNLQEGITSEIADVLYKSLNPVAVGVYVVAQHYCMKARFPAQNITEVVTTSFRGDYKVDNFREEFLNIANNSVTKNDKPGLTD